MLEQGLARTEPLWEPIRIAFAWVHAAANILKNESELSGLQVRRRFRGLLGAMRRWREKAAELGSAVDHFLKVTRSYWPGLFHCYDVQDLPRTNNDLEHLFGAHRYHERRTTGRKTASPALVLRGSVRIVAAVATRLYCFSAADLIPTSIASWRALRTQLTQRRYQRVLQRRFRQDSEAYLVNLEARLLKLILLL